MIYNNVEFVGVPFDVLIRKHREECDSQHDSMSDAATHFLDYLLNFDRRVGEDRLFIATVLVDAYTTIREKLRIINNRRLVGKTARSLSDSLSILLDVAIREANRAPLCGFLDDKTLEDYKTEYAEVCEQAFKTVFRGVDNLQEEIVEKTRILAFAIAKSSVHSEIFTGLVFGGFAKKDLFPTLHYLEIDGIYFNRIKVLRRKEVDIDRAGDHAQIVPFAQKEMAERFIYGIDNEFSTNITSLVGKLFDAVTQSKTGAFSAKEQAGIEKLIKERVESTLTELRQSERQSILDIVNFMSKKELAEMAAALVEVTSAKRRFSIQQETVGGPIDVAVISRSEGFVWIRRKHYFEQEANPGFFSRVFPRKGGSQNDSKTGA